MCPNFAKIVILPQLIIVFDVRPELSSPVTIKINKKATGKNQSLQMYHLVTIYFYTFISLQCAAKTFLFDYIKMHFNIIFASSLNIFSQ